MKRVTILKMLGAVMVIVALAGCDGNIFASLDVPPALSENDINRQASDNPEEFIADMAALLDDGAVSPDDAAIVAAALKTIYDDPESTDAEKQRASALAGTIRVSSNPEAMAVVNDIGGAIGALSSGDTSTNPEAVLQDILPTFSTREEFDEVVTTLLEAAADFSAFAGALDDSSGVDETGFSGGTKGDVTQVAIVSLAVKTAVDSIGADGLFKLLDDNSSNDSEVVFPSDFDPLAAAELTAILTYAGFSF